MKCSYCQGDMIESFFRQGTSYCIFHHVGKYIVNPYSDGVIRVRDDTGRRLFDTNRCLNKLTVEYIEKMFMLK
jgi:hypothetical protein